MKEILKGIGATEEDIKEMALDEDGIDITFFAFNQIDAAWWCSDAGFSSVEIVAVFLISEAGENKRKLRM